jgi:hypothetical protein
MVIKIIPDADIIMLIQSIFSVPRIDHRNPLIIPTIGLTEYNKFQPLEIILLLNPTGDK